MTSLQKDRFTFKNIRPRQRHGEKEQSLSEQQLLVVNTVSL